jgi:hypothetical protein
VTIGERIKKLGFARWYERTLIEAHAYLVSAFLGMILAFSGVELIGQHDRTGRILFGIGALIAGSAILAISVHRYLRTLMLAVNMGEHATCRQCNAYAAFNVLASGPPQGRTGHIRETDLWLKVKCRKCGSEWLMG